MKVFKLFLFLTTSQINTGFIFGQSDSSSIIRPFGFGIHIEQFGFNDNGGLKSGLANKILLSVSPMESIRLEPEIGFKFNSNEANDAVYYGLGIFAMSQRNRLNFYYGIRLKYSIINWQDIPDITSSIVTIDNRIKRFSIGPTLGCEYYLGENFTLGGEFAFVWSTINIIKPEPVYYGGESDNIVTDFGLFMRFYF